jgi:asparagine synthase (glutamine-hydrolysing)
MAFSREVRLPYLSHELVEFAFSLPSNFKLNNGWSKKILRDSMNGILPNEISWRKDKKGFQAPEDWLLDKNVIDLKNESIKKLKKEKIISAADDNKTWQYIMVYKLIENASNL